MITEARPGDVEAMLELAAARRQAYALYHPIFHRPADNAKESQRPFFQGLLSKPDFVVLVDRTPPDVIGFIVGHLVKAPPVYDPGGSTCVVDDFVVEKPEYWSTIGAGLLAEMRARARTRGAVQVTVVVAPEDEAKRSFLLGSGLRIVSEWAAATLREG